MITFRRLGRLGRFGNRLFQYAGTRLYAQSHGFEYAFPSWEGERIFGLTGIRLRYTDRLLPTVQLNDLSSTSWSERLLAPLGLWRRGSMHKLWREPLDNIDLYGYLQDDATLAMLRGHADVIRDWFRFIPFIDDAMRRAVPVSGPWAAVHVRRGDMVRRGAATDVTAALHVARNLSVGYKLYVASDDPAVAAEFAELHPFIVRPEPSVPAWLADFWMLRHSSLLIGSGSTFAWWAAFLGGMEYWAPPLNHTWSGTMPDIVRRIS